MVGGKTFPLIKCSECGFLMTDHPPQGDALNAYYKFRTAILEYEGVFHEKSRIESHTRYAALNVNAGYFLSPIPKIHLIPYVGVCLFHENIDGYFDSDGTYVSYPGNGYPPVHVSIDDRITTPTANIGLLAGYYLTNSFFITGGIKYMWDPYDGTYNSFPYTSMGIGYRF
ncbi:MAG TPA: hypothetical protein DEG28_07985 [Porphyromonadaceae bacterium]|nr:hypothetical protein [Porphyromonadaceae bacterium]